MESTTVVQRQKQVKLAELHPWEQNPRSITKGRFEALKQSMEADPAMLLARPLIALKDGRVIAGNMRLRAALELGWKTLPTVYVDLDEQTALTWALRDNNPYGQWEDDLLAEHVAGLEGADGLADRLAALTGFSDEELERLHKLSGLEPDERGVDLALADVSVGDPRHVVSKGEVWEVGPHVLVIENVYDGWPKWVGLLDGDALLVPYPTPTLPLTLRATKNRLVMVQPDVWLAGHVLDKYSAVNGDDTVRRQS